MDNTEDKDSRFRHLEVKIGVMTVAAVAGIILLIILIGVQKDLFSSKYHVHFITDSGSGFKVGMPVKLSGFKIGRVRDIELSDDAKVKVTAEINKKYERWLRSGSKATSAKDGLLGESFVEITLGPAKERVIADGEKIPYAKSGGMEDIMEEVKPILTEVKEIIHFMNSPEGDLKATLRNAKTFSSDLKETRSNVDKMVIEVGSTMKKTGAFIETLNAKTGAVLTTTNKLVGDVDTRMNLVLDKAGGAAKKADEAMSRLPVITEKLDAIANDVKKLSGALSSETPRLQRIMTKAEDTLTEGNALVKGIKEGWAGNLMMPEVKRRPELVPLDGYLIRKQKKDSQGSK
ncbi:MAG: MCE family protein [Deltaproteobacteria bacterium]|nr:MCE family protein [Deltaproteobacteria bacterium]